MHKEKILLACLTLWLLVSCQQTPPPTPQPTAQTVAATATQPLVVAPTNLPATPTLAVILPPATLTPIPTASLEPTPEGLTVPEGLILLDAPDLENQLNPFTGEPVADRANLERRPIAVKISNYPGGYVRPQSGLSQADWVVEHMTEGSPTRFTAIFYGKTPETVGPVRSARLIDVELPIMYDAALAFSGASIGVSQKLGRSEFSDRLLRDGTDGYYRTGDTSKPYEHTLYAHPANFWQVLEQNGLNTPPKFSGFMAFNSQPPSGGQPVSEIHLDFRGGVTADWAYDPATNRYLRWTDGEVHVDALTGEQLSAVNVMVVIARQELDVTICEFQTETGCNAYSLQVQIWGEGAAILFRDGQRFDGRWERVNRVDLLTFYDAAGNVLPFQIGNTWLEMYPAHYDPITTE